MEQSELKPCPNPACKSDAVATFVSGHWNIICGLCGMEGPNAASDLYARDAWNALPRSEPTGLRPCECGDRLEDKMLAIIEQISIMRQEKGLSQSDLARALGMDRGQFSRLLRSDNMTLATIARLEDALGGNILVTPDDYVEELARDQSRLCDVIEGAISLDGFFVAKIGEIFFRLADRPSLQKGEEGA